MIRWLRALSPITEFFTVILLAFGYFIFSSIGTAIFQQAPASISELHLQKLLIFEPIVLAILGLFLFVRRWNAKKLGFSFTLADLPIGVLLAITTYAAVWLGWLGVTAITGRSFADMPSTQVALPGFTIATVAAVSIVNSIYEELFVCAYVVSFMQRSRSNLTAVLSSAGIRFLYHLYQGLGGALSVLGVGLVFAAYFAMKRRSWPLVIAHGLLDLVALAPFVR